jgi:uncharacterized protein
LSATFVIACALSVLICLTLGLLGGGGSILTLPMLVYVAHVDPKVAIASSLLVVGCTSLVSLVPHATENRVQFRVGFTFALPAMAFAYAASKFVAPHFSARVLLIAFALLMLATAVNMIRGRKGVEVSAPLSRLYLLPIGAGAGFLSGLVGAGGGFVIVPALALVAGLPIAEAVATSLLVIALQSSVAFTAALGALTLPLPWGLVSGVTVAATLGSLVGAKLVPYVSSVALRRSFGVLVLILGFFQLVKNVARS